MRRPHRRACANRYDKSAPRRLMSRLDRDFDLHLVAEHRAAAFNRTIPLHTIAEPVHGRAGLEAGASAAVWIALQSKNMPIEDGAFGNATNRRLTVGLRSGLILPTVELRAANRDLSRSVPRYVLLRTLRRNPDRQPSVRQLRSKKYEVAPRADFVIMAFSAQALGSCTPPRARPLGF